MAMQNGLEDLLKNKMQKMQQQDLLKSLFSSLGQQQQPQMNDRMSQGFQDNSLEYNPNPQLNLGDFLQGGQKNAVERSVGKTPFDLPPMLQDLSRSQQQPMGKPQQPMMPEEAKSAGQKTEEEKAKNARQARIDKETFPYYEKVKNQASQTAEIDARLDGMDELLKSGNVQSNVMLEALGSLEDVPVLGKFAKAIEKAFTTHETQVFKKLSTDFLRDAKPYFGSNMSTTEVLLFLERVPSLMQSNEGKHAVIRNFRAMNDYTKAVDKALEEVIAENGGERPRHIQSLVANKLKKSGAGENLRKAFRDSVKLIPKEEVGKGYSQFDSLPAAKSFKGKTITDTQTGKKYKSNGSKWVKA